MALTASYRIEHREPTTHGGATLTVSRHALVRLAERADVRDIPEMLQAYEIYGRLRWR